MARSARASLSGRATDVIVREMTIQPGDSHLEHHRPSLRVALTAGAPSQRLAPGDAEFFAVKASPVRSPETGDESYPPAMRSSGPGQRGTELFSSLHLPRRLTQNGLHWLEGLSRDVRIHTDVAAHRVAAALGADAVTLGREIFFRSGRFDPHSPRGLALVAHELTHVAQQDRAQRMFSVPADSNRAEGHEREALATERSVYHLLASRDRQAAIDVARPLSDRSPLNLQFARAVAPPAAFAPAATLSPARSAVPMPMPMKAAETREVEAAGSAPPADPTLLAGQVFRLLERRLRVDKERLGIGRA
jgi:hypothetical protein